MHIAGYRFLRLDDVQIGRWTNLNQGSCLYCGYYYVLPPGHCCRLLRDAYELGIIMYILNYCSRFGKVTFLFFLCY